MIHRLFLIGMFCLSIHELCGMDSDKSKKTVSFVHSGMRSTAFDSDDSDDDTYLDRVQLSCLSDCDKDDSDFGYFCSPDEDEDDELVGAFGGLATDEKDVDYDKIPEKSPGTVTSLLSPSMREYRSPSVYTVGAVNQDDIFVSTISLDTAAQQLRVVSSSSFSSVSSGAVSTLISPRESSKTVSFSEPIITDVTVLQSVHVISLLGRRSCEEQDDSLIEEPSKASKKPMLKAYKQEIAQGIKRTYEDDQVSTKRCKYDQEEQSNYSSSDSLDSDDFLSSDDDL